MNGFKGHSGLYLKQYQKSETLKKITQSAIRIFQTLCLSVLIGSASQSFAQSNGNRNDLPEIGVVASDAISLDKEQQIGAILMRQLRGQAPLVSDPLLEEYIQDVGNRLVVEAESVRFPFTFFLINNPEINAFAFFGGHIGVHTGLIYHANTESELASVLAHEIAHVTQRHIARRIQSQQRSSPLQIASMLGGILLALADTEAGIAAISASNAASQQAAINYTRSNEKEADRIGMRILSNSGYDPRAAASFFSIMAAKYRIRSKPPQFLLTHPLPESRIADARSRAASLPARRVPPSLSFHLAKARILARFYGNTKNNILYFENQIKKQEYVFRAAADYGLALSFMRAEDYVNADKIISRLMKYDPENLFYLDAATDIALGQEQFDIAIELLTKHAERTPRNRVLTLNLANAAMQQGDFAKATRLLKDYLLVNPDHLLTHQLLSDAYAENRQLLEMHQSKAEVYALVAAYPRAIDELQHAYNYAADRKLEKQRIRARIDQLREEQNRLKGL